MGYRMHTDKLVHCWSHNLGLPVHFCELAVPHKSSNNPVLNKYSPLCSKLARLNTAAVLHWPREQLNKQLTEERESIRFNTQPLLLLSPDWNIILIQIPMQNKQRRHTVYSKRASGGGFGSFFYIKIGVFFILCLCSFLTSKQTFKLQAIPVCPKKSSSLLVVGQQLIYHILNQYYTMQRNAVQYHTIQCNTLRCNETE